MALKYTNPQFDPQKLSIYNIDRQAVENVPPQSLVLDVGCATGFMGSYLKQHKSNRVYGLDIRPEEIKIAKRYLEEVIKGDIVDTKVINEILEKTRHKKFDVILATSVIEHVTDTKQAIRNMINILKPGGLLIITTPNIAHWSTRFSLLFGKFDYTDYGILDHTHLHLFTAETFRKLITNEGLKIEKFAIDAEGGGYPRLSLMLAKLFPNLFAYQMLIVAKKVH